jgi:solute carrier family 25 protein 34/35
MSGNQASGMGLATQRPISTFEKFVCGGLAACMAVTVTNPAEMAKTRMQLQGILHLHE